MAESTEIFGGVEGGGTHSTLILMNKNSEVVAMVEGPGTNLYQIGMDETCIRLANMCRDALKKAAIEGTKLSSLGLSLSGCEVEETSRELAEKFFKKFPDLVAKIPEVCSDTVGSLLTASENGGVVLISGTGSNSLLVNPNGTTARCGGWGHMLGDEGSAWWISHLAIKTWFDEEDNLAKPKFDTSKVKAAVKKYFGINDRFGLLTFCYDNFTKSHFSGLCQSLAVEAENGDTLCKWLFSMAGQVLAKYIVALQASMSAELKASLSIVCIGSVWNSWHLLKDSFVDEMKSNATEIEKYILVKLIVPMATGACYLAAGKSMLKKHGENTTTFYESG